MSPALDFFDWGCWGCFCRPPPPPPLVEGDGEGEPSRCGRSSRSSSADESTAADDGGGEGGVGAAAAPPLLPVLPLLDFPLPLLLAFRVERAIDGEERVARCAMIWFGVGVVSIGESGVGGFGRIER
jgi:hypothetical protein